MKEFVCEDCKGKSYSAADLDKQVNPECPYCGSKKLKDTNKQECRAERTRPPSRRRRR